MEEQSSVREGKCLLIVQLVSSLRTVLRCSALRFLPHFGSHSVRVLLQSHAEVRLKSEAAAKLNPFDCLSSLSRRLCNLLSFLKSADRMLASQPPRQIKINYDMIAWSVSPGTLFASSANYPPHCHATWNNFTVRL